ncbi:hypothetical protein NXS13_00885 [Corynebacterium sp. ES2730-CONJ]|uniref:hypothetical protein n=1 Tax=Corynebacterium sp. ES2730-CONJ TaxID=2973941 RepID=UPI00216ADEC1|nr:hypothetical protein [Corynebacterium sp. ES2730-CONJ]MCS4491055.1 hypothetical protein [Corynebacterium sp. ES2715-CONJ3]MCS4531064.1 hypothetical protein [Corynebacterium sp. ES2730-CONJ]
MTGIPQAVALVDAADSLVSDSRARGLGSGPDLISQMHQLNMGQKKFTISSATLMLHIDRVSIKRLTGQIA